MLATKEKARQDSKKLKLKLATKSLYNFTKQAWHIIEPKKEFIDSWHLRKLCEELEEVTHGRQDRLLVNMPPRHAKSITINVFWFCWSWIHKPNSMWIFATSEVGLAQRDSLKCRMILESEWYLERWGDIVEISKDQNEKKLFNNTAGGTRLCRSIGSKVTGRDADFIVCDDMNDVNDVKHKGKRDDVLYYFNEVLMPRLNEEHSAVVVMQQRCHEDDVAGDILANIKELPYRHLELKAIAESRQEFKFLRRGETVVREKGSPLWAERFGLEFLRRKKLEVRDKAFSAQYQQTAVPDKGDIFDTTAINYLSETPKNIKRTIISMDTAFKDGEENDYCVLLTWRVFEQDGRECFYLQSMTREKMKWPRLKKMAEALLHRYKPNNIVIEDKASGQSLIQELELNKEWRRKIKGIQPDGDKVFRANGITDIFDQGRIFFNDKLEQLDDALNELKYFPAGKHDDFVDALVYAIGFLIGIYGIIKQPKIRSL